MKTWTACLKFHSSGNGAGYVEYNSGIFERTYWRFLSGLPSDGIQTNQCVAQKPILWHVFIPKGCHIVGLPSLIFAYCCNEYCVHLNILSPESTSQVRDNCWFIARQRQRLRLRVEQVLAILMVVLLVNSSSNFSLSVMIERRCVLL